MGVMAFLLTVAAVSMGSEDPEVVPVIKTVLQSKTLKQHYSDRYFSGGRPMLVIGSMLPEKKELKLEERRFILYSKLPSDTGRVPAGLRVDTLTVKNGSAEVVCTLPAEEVGYRFQLQKTASVWKITSTKPIKRETH